VPLNLLDVFPLKYFEDGLGAVIVFDFHRIEGVFLIEYIQIFVVFPPSVKRGELEHIMLLFLSYESGVMSFCQLKRAEIVIGEVGSGKILVFNVGGYLSDLVKCRKIEIHSIVRQGEKGDPSLVSGS